MKLTAITATGDRPEALDLCRFYMGRQTRKADRWLVVDDGAIAYGDHMEEATYLRRRHDPDEPAPVSHARNLLHAIAHLPDTDALVFIEDDDWYDRCYLARMEFALEHAPLVGQQGLYFYHLPTRQALARAYPYAPMAAMAMDVALVPKLVAACDWGIASKSKGIDKALWKALPARKHHLWKPSPLIQVGLKGLPGRAGIGIGHRPDERWDADPELAILNGWIGRDAQHYLAWIGAPA